MTNETILLELKVDQRDAKKQITEISKEIVKERDLIRELSKDYENNAAAITEAELKVKELSREKNALIKTTQNANTVLKAETGSLTQLKAVAALMNVQYQKMQGEMRETSAEGILLAARLREINNTINEQQKNAGDYTRNIGRYAEGFREVAGSLVTGGASFSGAITGITASIPALAAFSPIIGSITGGLETGVKDMIELRGQISQLTGETGEILNQNAATVDAIAETFNKDKNEIIIGANAMSKAFGIDFASALNLVEKGFLSGANVSGDFLNQVKEYSPQFKAAGASAEDLIATISQNVKDGIFSDKGADVIKEFGLRIREQAKPTKDALDKAFGQEFTNNLFKGLNEGSISTVQALKLVSTELNTTKATTREVQTVIADVFGGPGEDAGLAYLKTLQNINGNLDAQIDKDNELVKRQIANLEATKQFDKALADLSSSFDFLAESSGGFLKKAGAFIIDYIAVGVRRITGFVTFIREGFRILVDSATATGRALKAAITFDFAAARKAAEDYKKSGREALQLVAEYTLGVGRFGVKAAEENKKVNEQVIDQTKDAEDKLTDEELKLLRERQRKILELKLKDQEAFLDLQLLSAEKFSKKELDLQVRLAKTKRDQALFDEQLTQNQRLLIIAKTEADVTKLILASQNGQIQQISDSLTQEEKIRNQKALDFIKGSSDTAKIELDLLVKQLEQRSQFLTSSAYLERKIAKDTADFKKKKEKEAFDEFLKNSQSQLDSAIIISESLSKINSNLLGEAAQNTLFGKSLASVQISLEAGKAIASVIAAATASGAFSGPTAIVTTLANILTGVAAVSSAIGQARKLIQVPVPSPPNRAAGGGDFITSGPTTLLVGDNPGGRELVSVTPLSGKGQTVVDPRSGLIKMAGGGTLLAESRAIPSRAQSDAVSYSRFLEAIERLEIVTKISDIENTQGRKSKTNKISDI